MCGKCGISKQQVVYCVKIYSFLLHFVIELSFKYSMYIIEHGLLDLTLEKRTDTFRCALSKQKKFFNGFQLFAWCWLFCDNITNYNSVMHLFKPLLHQMSDFNVHRSVCVGNKKVNKPHFCSYVCASNGFPLIIII